MFKVSITNSLGVETNAGTFKTQIEADKWVTEQKANESFGRNDRWVIEDDIVKLGEDVTKAIGTQQVVVDSNGTSKTQYHFAADYHITQTDISAEVAQQAAVSQGLFAQQLGAEIVAHVFSINESSGIAQDALVALLSDPAVALIERLLFNGSLVTAKAKIAALPPGMFSPAQIAGVLALLEDSIKQVQSYASQYIANS